MISCCQLDTQIDMLLLFTSLEQRSRKFTPSQTKILEGGSKDEMRLFEARNFVSFAVPCPNEDGRTVERAFQCLFEALSKGCDPIMGAPEFGLSQHQDDTMPVKMPFYERQSASKTHSERRTSSM
jgi:hypothetical protein